MNTFTAENNIYTTVADPRAMSLLEDVDHATARRALQIRSRAKLLGRGPENAGETNLHKVAQGSGFCRRCFGDQRPAIQSDPA